MRAKCINEKFEENTDPIADLGVGGVVLQDFFEKTQKKLEKDIKKLKETSARKYEEYLRELLMGKTITGNMEKLATYDKDTMKQKTSGSKGKFTIKVNDIAVQNFEYEWNNYIIVVSDDHNVYKLKMTEKVYIR